MAEKQIVSGTDVWPAARPDEDEGETMTGGICAMCGQSIQIPLGPTIVADQCSCGVWFWISEPDGDNFDTVCGLIEQALGKDMIITQSEPVEQYLTTLVERSHYLKIRDERFDKSELIAEYGEQDWMLGYVCFLKLDPPPTMEMFR